MNLPTIQLNEKFGPTLQGEGREIGKPCLFIRLHNCPVKCPGCDTAYTWNGSEEGTKTVLDDLWRWVVDETKHNTGLGVVVSGGEPLIHYKNGAFHEFLENIGNRAAWVSLETSGFVGPQPLEPNTAAWNAFFGFAELFDSVHLSPKITPCLHGAGWTDEQLCVNIPLLLSISHTTHLALKFVAKDENDIHAIRWFLDRFHGEADGVPVYLMPFGVEREEILETCERLLPFCIRHGWTLSPRLHSLIWGKKRGV